MARLVLLDTGPVVALINSRDPDHNRVVQSLGSLRARFVSVEGVFVEASHLLRKTPDATAKVIELALRLRCEIHPATPERLASAVATIRSHRGLKLDLVDGLLISAADDLDIGAVLTLDRRDFSRVRRKDGRAFDILPD